MQIERFDSSFNQTKPAIVLVTTSFPIAGDGSEAAGSFVLDLANELARHGPCRVVAPGAINSLEVYGENLEVFRFKAPDRPLSTLKPWLLQDIVQIFKIMRAGRAATLAAVTAGPTRQILALWAFPSGHWARQVAIKKNIPYLVWTLGSDIWSLGRIPLARGAIRRVLRDSKAIYSDGIRLAEATSQLSGRKVEFLPSTRSIERAKSRLPRESAPYRMVFLGRWHPNKGIDLLMEALESLDASDWEKIESFQIYGGGALESDVRRRATALMDVGCAVSVGGYIDKAQAEDLIAEADWLIVPSRIESIPLVFSDAIKLNTPLVATPVGDLAGLMQKYEIGILCTSATAEEIRAGIRLALRSSAREFTHDMESLSLQFSLRSSVVPILLGYEPLSNV